MASTRGGEKHKAPQHKTTAAESSSRQFLRGEDTKKSTMQEKEEEIEITPTPDGKVTIPPTVPAAPVDKVAKGPTRSHASEKEGDAKKDELPLRKCLQTVKRKAKAKTTKKPKGRKPPGKKKTPLAKEHTPEPKKNKSQKHLGNKATYPRNLRRSQRSKHLGT